MSLAMGNQPGGWDHGGDGNDAYHDHAIGRLLCASDLLQQLLVVARDAKYADFVVDPQQDGVFVEPRRR